MVTSYNKPLFPYDLAFTGQMGQLGQAREAAEARPVDYSRLGGAALGKRGEMYGSLYDAASRAAGARRSAEQNRELAWRKASREKEAQAERIKAENVASVVTGVAGLGNMFAKKLGGTAQKLGLTGEVKEGKDFGTAAEIAKLVDAGTIKQVMGRAPLDEATGLPFTADTAPEGGRESKLFPNRGVVGTGQYRYTPDYLLKPENVGRVFQGAFGEPYWWEGKGSTGGWGR